MADLSKPRLHFMRWLFGAWLGLPVRRTMLNLARFGPYCDKSLRLQLTRAFDFAAFNRRLIEQRCGPERVGAFDPTYIAKAGHHTYGVDYWWCGTRQKAVRGLELGVLGVIDVAARSALVLQAVQTPPLATLHTQGSNLLAHYARLLQQQQARLAQLGVRYMTADAYFAKQGFVDAVCALQLHLVTRLRQDANLRYLYHGPRAHTGRPKKYDGKVDCQRIDKRRLRRFRQDATGAYYSGVVYAVALKRVVRIVYIQDAKSARYRILMSSDPALAPDKIVEYYKLRFQIEFLIRDAKTHAGLEECQARGQDKLNFHFNLALSSVSWIKAACWLNVPAPQRGAFSLGNSKLLFTGQLWAKRVFHNLGWDLSLSKHQAAYERCLHIEQLMA